MISILSFRSFDENIERCMAVFVASELFERDVKVLKNFFVEAYLLGVKEFETI